MHDVAFFESKGLPSVAVLSDAFQPQAAYQAQKLGLQATVRLFVKHPISDQTPAQMHAKADVVYGDVVDALTTQPVEIDDSAVAAAPAAEPECAT
eukprot:m.14357 g.14357  ORF g.14357 m.14357 type:complete len:95 (+) comp4786_c0_seq1:1606-1890(+)